MRRREFITLLGGAAAAWPIAARGQQSEQIRRIGVLMPWPANDSNAQARIRAFGEALRQLGWTDGRNLQLDIRWASIPGDIRKYAAELAAMTPDVIVCSGASALGPLVQATRTVPIVFVIVPDPVGAGLVDSLARPGGNVTGFAIFEYAFGTKWLELLKEIVPLMKRVAVVRDAALPAGTGQFAAVQTAAIARGVELTPINMRDASEIERAIAAFAQSGSGGLIVTGSGLANVHRELIVSLAARHKLPATYFSRDFVTSGGLASYGIDNIDQFRRAASYVDRILKGEKPADLPVQTPTKYELVINLKTAKALGLQVPPTLLATADEVIE